MSLRDARALFNSHWKLRVDQSQLPRRDAQAHGRAFRNAIPAAQMRLVGGHDRLVHADLVAHELPEKFAARDAALEFEIAGARRFVETHGVRPECQMHA